MAIDTHSHLNMSSFEKDKNAVIKKCLENNVLMINVGTDFFDSNLSVEIAEKFQKGVYAAVGLHPENIGESFNCKKYKKLALSSKKVVAIGEIGLDYLRKPKSKTKREVFFKAQKELFLDQLTLADELGLPVIIHSRMAFDDLYEILSKRETKGVIHCFSGSWEDAKKFLGKGFYLGFNGIIFKINLEETIKKIPLDRMLVETDCPFLTPPNFSEERNNPLAVFDILEKISQIRGINSRKLEEITTDNAKHLFKLK